jgi:hypothetical protein
MPRGERVAELLKHDATQERQEKGYVRGDRGNAVHPERSIKNDPADQQQRSRMHQSVNATKAADSP